MQVVRTARCFAFDNAGSNMAARIAMIAMTTSSSINVNPRDHLACHVGGSARFRFNILSFSVSRGQAEPDRGLCFILISKDDFRYFILTSKGLSRYCDSR